LSFLAAYSRIHIVGRNIDSRWSGPAGWMCNFQNSSAMAAGSNGVPAFTNPAIDVNAVGFELLGKRKS
jgi:hypothetical protein